MKSRAAQLVMIAVVLAVFSIISYNLGLNAQKEAATTITATTMVSTTITATITQPLNVDLDTWFQLKVNQTASIKPNDLKVRFLNVVEDSRCPSDVVCVWAGQVTVVVDITRDDRSVGAFNLTSSPGRKDLSVKIFDGYSIRLVRVDPYPKSSQRIELSDYVATLVVSKR